MTEMWPRVSCKQQNILLWPTSSNATQPTLNFATYASKLMVVPCGIMSKKKKSKFENIVAITFPAEDAVLNYFFFMSLHDVIP